MLLKKSKSQPRQLHPRFHSKQLLLLATGEMGEVLFLFILSSTKEFDEAGVAVGFALLLFEAAFA